MGIIIDPFNPKLSNTAIVDKLSREENINNFFEKINLLSGRFVLMVRDSSNNYYILNDACGLRQIYFYNNDNYYTFSSFPELIFKVNNLKPNIDNDTLKILNSKTFIETEFAWYGDSWYDKRIKKYCLIIIYI